MSRPYRTDPPQTQEAVKRAALTLSFLAPFAVFLATAYPAFRLDDSPETVAAAVNISVQHMPGYPAVTILDGLFARLPAGAPAFRVAVCSAALGGGVCAATAGLVAAMFPTPWGIAAGALSAVTLAFAPPFWEEALSAKGSVYLLNLLLVALMVRALLSPRALPFVALLGGIALSGHWMTAACWLPVMLLAARPLAGRPLAGRSVGIGLALLGLGLTAYLALTMYAGREPVWGDPGRLGGLMGVITRREFIQQATKPASLGFLQFLWGVLYPLSTAGPAFVLLALAGAATVASSRPRILAAIGGGALANVILVSAVANPLHRSSGELSLWHTAPFLLPLVWACAALTGPGILLVRRAAGRHGTPAFAACLLVPAWLLATGMRDTDHSADYTGPDFARNLLAPVRGPALVMAEADYNSWPLYIPAWVDPRPGIVLVVTHPFLERRWGWRRLAGRIPEARGLETGESAASIGELAERVRPRLAPWHHLHCSDPVLRARFRYEGLLAAVEPPGSRPGLPAEPAVARRFSRMSLRGLFSEHPRKDPTSLTVLDTYCLARALPAERERTAGRIPGALEGYRRAAKFPGWFGRAGVWRDLGLAAAILGRDAEAEQAFRAAYAIRPHDLDSVSNAAVACARQGKSSEAARLSNWVQSRR